VVEDKGRKEVKRQQTESTLSCLLEAIQELRSRAGGPLGPQGIPPG